MASNAQDIVTDIKAHVSEKEWSMRVDLAAAYRLIAHFGWDDLIFTHLSARVPGEDEHFLINPFGLMFDEITASNLVKVDVDGKAVVPTPYPVNPAGFTIHSAIHTAGNDAHCIMHVHTVTGCAVAAQKRGLLKLTQMAAQVFNDVAYHDYEGVAVVEEEKARLVADMGDKGSLILRNHGLLTVGKDVGEAFLRLYMLQRACEMQIAAQSGGGALIELPDAQVQLVDQQTKGAFAPASYMTWAALRRRAEKLDPSFME